MQFPEHENGQKSTNPKIQKLDKLARLLNVQIIIDNVQYGADIEVKDNTLNAEKIAEQYIIKDEKTDPEKEPDANTVKETVEEKPKSRGRPKKVDK